MLETWRWFGPNDPVKLNDIREAGASGIVTSLHQVATGEAWPAELIAQRKHIIEDAGLVWSVVESIPLHNDIKTRTGNFNRYLDHYKTSIKNLGEAGIQVVCYNFMPVVDWTRTQLMYRVANGSHALRFDMYDFAAYDLYILNREHAENDYSREVIDQAQLRFQKMSQHQQIQLEKNIIAGLPGGEGAYSRASIREKISQFIQMGEDTYREHLQLFLQEIIPVAEAADVRMCIHPDDPPFSLFGLPRVVSTANDVRELLAAKPSHHNGLTLCAGSFGARADNNLVEIAEEFSQNIHFVHLRNVIREANGSFYEAEHLAGDNDMVGLIEVLLKEERRRLATSREDACIPMRPDHGHLMSLELGHENTNPGYSFAGRMKGLAELRGVMHALETLSDR